MCLHLLIQSCPPTAWHGDNIRERISLVHLHMDKLCFQTPPSTTTSTSTVRPTTPSETPRYMRTMLKSTQHKSTPSTTIVTNGPVRKTSPNLVTKKTAPTVKGYNSVTRYDRKSTLSHVEYKIVKSQKSQSSADVTTVNNEIKLSENRAKLQNKVKLQHIEVITDSACRLPHNVHFVLFSFILMIFLSR